MYCDKGVISLVISVVLFIADLIFSGIGMANVREKYDFDPDLRRKESWKVVMGAVFFILILFVCYLIIDEFVCKSKKVSITLPEVHLITQSPLQTIDITVDSSFPTSTLTIEPTDITITQVTQVNYVQISYPHQNTTFGSGLFSSVEISDGNLQYDSTFVNAKYPGITLINTGNSPAGCGRAVYASQYIWFVGQKGAALTVDGIELGQLTQSTGSHGFLLEYSVSSNSDICITNMKPNTWQIAVGPDVVVHYDSFCYRGWCG